MTRSIWKGPFIAPCFFRKKYRKSQTSNVFFLQTHSRSSLIMPQFVGQKIGVYNGQKYIVIRVKEEMVGHKFGEFSFCRKRTIHKKKTKK